MKKQLKYLKILSIIAALLFSATQAAKTHWLICDSLEESQSSCNGTSGNNGDLWDQMHWNQGLWQ